MLDAPIIQGGVCIRTSPTCVLPIFAAMSQSPFTAEESHHRCIARMCAPTVCKIIHSQCGVPAVRDSSHSMRCRHDIFRNLLYLPSDFTRASPVLNLSLIPRYASHCRASPHRCNLPKRARARWMDYFTLHESGLSINTVAWATRGRSSVEGQVNKHTEGIWVRDRI
jgi:hypothetical protein